MKTRVLTLVTCLAAIALFAGFYFFILPKEVMAAPSGKCCLETGECNDRRQPNKK